MQRSRTPFRVDSEAVREWVARTRREQGLPAQIEDPVVIARIVTILREVEMERLVKTRKLARPSDHVSSR